MSLYFCCVGWVFLRAAFPTIQPGIKECQARRCRSSAFFTANIVGKPEYRYRCPTNNRMAGWLSRFEVLVVSSNSSFDDYGSRSNCHSSLLPLENEFP